MTSDAYWLPAIDDWSAAIGSIERMDGGEAAWTALIAAAGHRLDFLRTERLDRSLRRLFGTPPAELQTQPIRLAILGSSTTSHLGPSIRIAGLRRGLHFTIYEAEYGQYRQELADPASVLHVFAPTSVLLAFDSRHLLGNADQRWNTEEADAELMRVLADLEQTWDALQDAFACHVIQQTLLPIFLPLMGSNEQVVPGLPAAMLSKLNAALRPAAAAAGVHLLALDAKAAEHGLATWHDPALWHRAKQEVRPSVAPIYGDLVARLLAAAQGRSAKCLVLDLDNTIWGGVIGDQGVEGIVIGQGSAEGEAFASFQSYAAALARRGVILAVCSKNDEANALEAFDTHPDMVLKRADISAFVANWSDKASNLRAIAQTLNIGLDALVFADDNPFERNLIRQKLPMVAVPELPDDPALYARCISDAGYFEALGVTKDDRERTHQYAANCQRSALLAEATDLDGYLASLDMQLRWRRFDRIGLARITQLINKTNQFNLTTRRYTDDEVAAVMADDRAFGLQFRLTDRFGDNGMITVVIGRLSGETAEIETWLMSCRVLGRRVEEATLDIVMAEARRLGAARVVGRYLPTAKNGMVANHYPKLGFVPVATDDMSQGSRYEKLTTRPPAGCYPITVIEE